MKRLITQSVWGRRIANASFALLMSVLPALAEGSLPLGEVLSAVTTEQKLVTEIRAEVAKQGVNADTVVCTAARHGSQWKYLGGIRAAPYSCKIGTREVAVSADRVYFDKRERNIGDSTHASPKAAKSFREANFRWVWVP